MEMTFYPCTFVPHNTLAMRNNFRILLFLLLMSFNIHFCVAQKSDGSFCRLVDSSLNSAGKISLKLKGDLKLTKQQLAGGTGKLEFRSATDLLSVRTWNNIEDSTAVKMINDKKFLIENLFITQPSPYPDAVSNKVDCPDRLKPLPFDSIYPNFRIAAFRLYANDRFIYGECTDDVIVYTSAYILAYNKKEKILTEIKYFTPKSRPVNIPEEVMRGIK
jgi:hypothetical protein